MLFTVTAEPPVKQTPPGLAKLQKAIDSHARHSKALFDYPGVNGSGVGWRRDDGEPVVKVFTRQKNTPNLPQFIDGVPVDVQYIGEVFALKAGGKNKSPNDLSQQDASAQIAAQAGSVSTTARFDRPVPIGVSAGHTGVTAGTIGCRVSQGCHTYALSNNHVFANKNAGNIGDNILQPGPYDGGQNPADAIGTLYDYVEIEWHPENRFQPKPLNYIDSAIVDVAPSQVGYETPENGYGIPKAETMAAYVGQKVMKYGRTTQLTYGAVDSLNVLIDVNFGTTSNPKYARFAGQIVIEAAPDASYNDFSLGGDSGSLIVGADSAYPLPDCASDPVGCNDYPPAADERKPMGLLFAGGGGITVANPIDDVLDAYGVVIDGE